MTITAQSLLDGGYTKEDMAKVMADMLNEHKRLRQVEADHHGMLKDMEKVKAQASDGPLFAKRYKSEEPSSPAAAKERLKRSVKFFYDIQRLRMQTKGRYNAKAPGTEVHLSPSDKLFFEKMADELDAFERQASKEVTGLLKHFKISAWLMDQHGLGPTMAGVIITSIDIHRAHTTSSLWAVSGLNVVNGKAPKPKKGEKLRYNAWLRSKLVGVMANNFLKSNSPWREHYDNYKNRKESQIVDVCMGCQGTGKKGRETCPNCEGGTKPAPWGMSKGHRHNASLRYMVKMFLARLYEVWREQEGLEIRNLYQEQYLGHQHTD